MIPLKCPLCKARLGNYAYAAACPHCHGELVHNTRPMVSSPVVEYRLNMSWPYRLCRRIKVLVES